VERDDLCVRFKKELWKEYYVSTSNIKYPPVNGLQLPAEFTAKVELLRLLLQERTDICKFDPRKLKDCFALLGEIPQGTTLVLIPSGGKDSKWVGSAIKAKKFWWTRLLNIAEVQVVFVVAQEEVESYKLALASHNEGVAKHRLRSLALVAYPGFGIGCGRAAAVQVARQTKCLSFITDDRTLDVKLSGVAMANGADFQKLVSEGGDGLAASSITSVTPFGRCQVLTIVNPSARLRHSDSAVEPPHLCFPPVFIASKEDLALDMCLTTCARLESTTALMWKVQVLTDTKNPPYENKAVVYGGEKGKTLSELLSSKLYRSLDDEVLNWKALQLQGFTNMWDGIKMQESAMYQLLESIQGELAAGRGDQDMFDRLIVPFFYPF
jgi:hypothetical protein